MNKRRWLLVAVIALFIAGALFSGRSATGDRAPGGTLAMRRTLVALGVEVRDADDPPPPPATFVLLHDFRDEVEAAHIRQWVESGGRLVLADPESILAEEFGVVSAGAAGSVGSSTLTPGCATAAAGGVRRIVVAGNAPLLASENPGAIGCFFEGRGSFLADLRAGDGEVIALGSASPFTNEFFGRADNALFAANVLGTRGPVVFGPAVPRGAEAIGGGLWATLPTAAKVIVAQLALAFALFALVRGRRLGRAPRETPRVPIPAGELVRATGRLLRSARATQHASKLMREHLARRVAARLGLGSGAEAQRHAQDLPGSASAALRVGDATNDAELIELGRKLEDARKELEGADR